MTAAPSEVEREGAAWARSDVNTDPVQPAQHSSTPHRQGIDYVEPVRSAISPDNSLEAKTVRIVSGPVSLKTLAFCGLVIFIVAFLHGRQMSRLVTPAGEPISRESPSVAQTATTLTVAPTPQSSAAIAGVTIQLVKFTPETMEVSAGQTVEWVNNDLTPHTVTSQGTGDLNSGSIDAGASWHHTFRQAGNFPYYCTFHPEMKGTVIVK